VCYGCLLGVVDIVLVQDVLLQLADFIRKFLLNFTVGLVFFVVVHPDQCLRVLHLQHLLFQTVSSRLHSADLGFRVLLPPFVRPLMFDKAVYV
jgi:hypothetical protein